MGCAASKALSPASDLQRPAEVPCPGCGVINYIEPGRHGVSCFKCNMACHHTQPNAVGLKSSQEHTVEKFRAEGEEEVSKRMLKSLPLAAGP